MKPDKKKNRLCMLLGDQAAKLVMEACLPGDTPNASHLESAISSLRAELRSERDLRDQLQRQNKQLSQHLAELVESNKISVCAYSLALDQMARELRSLRKSSETEETPHDRAGRAALLEALMNAKGSLL